LLGVSEAEWLCFKRAANVIIHSFREPYLAGMKPDFGRINAVILDLGGVILNIDYQRTIDAFQALGFDDFDAQYSKMQQSGLFDDLETGRIDQAVFVQRIQTVIPHAEEAQIINAWNALLLDFPEGRIATVERIAARFPTSLLSNTNAIHYRAFSKTLEAQTGRAEIESLFVKAYLSHEVGMRKPDREIFMYVLNDQGLDAENTLFIDDSPQHLVGAQSCGIQTYHMTDGDSLEALFRPVLTEL
jgi:putative hydrolase of the HAD superfamily